MRRSFHLGALAVSLSLLTLLTATLALAHPLGNFTVNHYSRIEPAGDGVRVVYVLDLAEIPTFQEQPQIDLDRDGQLGEAEWEQYADRRAEELRRGLDLRLDGAPADVRLVSRELSFPPGQGGLPTLRLVAVYRADLPSGGGPLQLTYRDGNDPTRIGWREIVARPGAAGTRIEQASVPAEDRSDELRSYPEDLLNSPLDVREARLTFVPGPAAAGPPASVGDRAVERSKDVYAELVAADDLSPGAILFYLAFAMWLGAGHALSPGHGKAVVAAYLVGSRGTARHALFLGATVTITHTIGVYALGLVALYLSQYVLPERLYPILQIVSGLLVVGIGGWLFVTRLRGALAARDHDHPDAHHHDHDHGHEHDQDHDHTHDHQHARGHEHAHGDDHVHAHSPALALATGQSSRVDCHAGSDERALVGADPLTHSHGGRPHSHLPPGAAGQGVTWRSLLALGVSGGLLPCPAALVVLLGAIALHRVAFGLLLIVAFSVGLAAVLTGIGLLLVYARRSLQRLDFGGPVARLLPIASALVIVVAGLAITLQALPQAL
jgi:nickel/cobalt exporter